jgi:hypothetical protein
MKATTTTPTTFERFSTVSKTRQVVTVLSVSAASAVCAVETITPDGRDIPDRLTSIHRAAIPRAILSLFYTDNHGD